MRTGGEIGENFLLAKISTYTVLYSARLRVVAINLTITMLVICNYYGAINS